jgi:intracellular septation protein A
MTTTKKTATKKVAKKRVYAKILGQEVLVGSKQWEKLTYQVKLFNQLNKSENM